MSTIFCQYSIPTYVGYDNLFQTGILCSKKAVHLLQRRCRCIPQASLVSNLVQSIPNWNTLFKKGCASAAAQMLPHSTGIVRCQYPRTIHPSWGTIFVCRPYFTLFLSTKKFVAGQIKNIVLPPPLPPHRLTLAAAGLLPPPMPHCRHGDGGGCRATEGVRAYP